MKCACCDRELSETEVQWNDEIKAWEMCSTCLNIALDAAYSQGFKIEEDEQESIEDEWDGYDISAIEEIQRLLSEHPV